MTVKVGDVNGYYCRSCTGIIYIRHADEGVTPMFLACRATKGCKGSMASMMYRLPDPEFHPLHITYEWFTPDDLSGYDEAMREHIQMGGLDLRRITCTVNDERCEHPEVLNG